MAAGRLKRFSRWSPEHQAKILKHVGLTMDDFGALGRHEQRETLDRAYNRGQRALRKLDAQRRQGNDPAAFTAPLTPNSANALADQLVGAKYGTAESQLDSRAAQVAPWFQNYQQQIGATQQRVQQQNAPIIANAQQEAQNTGKNVIQGVDPNSEAGHNDALAAAARQALVQSFASMLGAQQNAANTYFGQQQSVIAPQFEQSVASGIANQRQDLATEKGAFKASTLGDLRDKAHTQNLENAAFGLDEQKAAADVATDAAKLRQSSRDSADDFLAKMGVDRKTWRVMSPDERATWKRHWNKSPQTSSDALNKAKLEYLRQHGHLPSTGAGGGAAGEKSSNKAVLHIQDAASRWGQLRKKTVTDKATQQKRPPTASEVQDKLADEGYSPTEVRLALKIRSGRPLNRADLKAAERLGITDIPKRWVRPVKIRAKRQNLPGTTGTTGGSNGQIRPG